MDCARGNLWVPGRVTQGCRHTLFKAWTGGPQKQFERLQRQLRDKRKAIVIYECRSKANKSCLVECKICKCHSGGAWGTEHDPEVSRIRTMDSLTKMFLFEEVEDGKGDPPHASDRRCLPRLCMKQLVHR